MPSTSWNESVLNETFGPFSHLIPTSTIPQGAACLAAISAIVISICGIVGNLLTILALARFASRQTDIRRRMSPSASATTRFVVALAITDLFFCAAVLPVNAGRFWYRSWPLSAFACRLYPLIYYGTVASSLMLITAITINRLVLIAYHGSYRLIYSRWNVFVMIGFCWVFSYGIMVVPFFELYGRTGISTKTFSCTILRDSNNRSPKKFLFAFGFLLPATVIVLCYSVILSHVRAQTARVASLSQRSTNGVRQTSKRDLRLTGLICVVFGAFLGCFLPLFIGNVFVREDRYPYLHIAATICAWLNSCINPFIYFAMNARYRAALRRLFFGRPSHKLRTNHSQPSATNQGSVSLSAFGTKPSIHSNVNIASLKSSQPRGSLTSC